MKKLIRFNDFLNESTFGKVDNSLLEKGIIDNDLELVKKELKKDTVNPNVFIMANVNNSYTYITPIRYCILNHNIYMMELLLKTGKIDTKEIESIYKSALKDNKASKEYNNEMEIIKKYFDYNRMILIDLMEELIKEKPSTVIMVGKLVSQLKKMINK